MGSTAWTTPRSSRSPLRLSTATPSPRSPARLSRTCFPRPPVRPLSPQPPSTPLPPLPSLSATLATATLTRDKLKMPRTHNLMPSGPSLSPKIHSVIVRAVQRKNTQDTDTLLHQQRAPAASLKQAGLTSRLVSGKFSHHEEIVHS